MDEEFAGFSWRRLEFAGVSALAVVVACVLLGQSAERFADNVAPQTEIAAVKPNFNAIDYTATGSTKSGAVIISPCGARRP